MLSLRGARRGDRFRMLAWTPAGTGDGGAPLARRPPARAGASTGRIRVRRVPGFHAGPVEQLDALAARLTAPRSGVFAVRITA